MPARRKTAVHLKYNEGPFAGFTVIGFSLSRILRQLGTATSVILLHGMLLTSADCHGQQPVSPAVALTSNAALVTVPVSVRDHEGRPLTGLQKSDFTVLDEGHAQTIAVFEEVHASAAPQQGQSADKLTFSNLALAPAAAAPLIIAIDSINSPFLSQTRAKKGLIQYLATHLDANQPTALLLLTPKGIRQLHTFTKDTAALIAAAQRAQAKVAHSESELTDEDIAYLFGEDAPNQLAQNSLRAEAGFRQENAIRDTLGAFQQVARAFAGMRGRKSLVWLSSGFPLVIDDPRAITNMGSDFFRDYETTWELLNRAHIAVYPVNLEALSYGSGSNPYTGKARRPSSIPPTGAPRPDRDEQSVASLRAFAGATGGSACINNTNISECIGKAAADSRDYYLVAFYVSQANSKPGWHKLSVKLDRPHGEMQARSKYYLAQSSKPDARQVEMAIASAVASPMEYGGIGFSVRPESLSEASEKTKGISQRTSLMFRISFPAAGVTALDSGNGLSFDLLALPVNAAGVPLNEDAMRLRINLPPDKVAAAEKNGLTISQRLVLPIGSSLVKFIAVSQQDGSVGSVFVPLMHD